MAHPLFEQAKKAYGKAGKETASRQSMKTCGMDLGPGEVCLAQGLYVEEWRGTNYHIVGSCSDGHKTERYGYSDKVVKA
jgi:hypothetical protein